MTNLTEKVLDVTKKNGKFNRKIAKKAFRGRLSKVENERAYLHGTIMRTARKLNEDGLLVNRNGTFYLRSR